MTFGVQKSNEWIKNRLFRTDNEVPRSLCNNDMVLLMINGELFRAKPMLQL